MDPKCTVKYCIIAEFTLGAVLLTDVLYLYVITLWDEKHKKYSEDI
jgi:hypothetical protein